MDWVAAGFVVIGIWLVGKKSPYGFWWISFGACISAVLQSVVGLWGLAAQSVLVVMMNGWAYWKWTRKKKGA